MRYYDFTKVGKGQPEIYGQPGMQMLHLPLGRILGGFNMAFFDGMRLTLSDGVQCLSVDLPEFIREEVKQLAGEYRGTSYISVYTGDNVSDIKLPEMASHIACAKLIPASKMKDWIDRTERVYA